MDSNGGYDHASTVEYIYILYIHAHAVYTLMTEKLMRFKVGYYYYSLQSQNIVQFQ